jgi:tripartite-type tricarboxylate transporter receptor subunit TctC
LKKIAATIGVACIALTSLSAISQADYPTRPVKLIIPFAAGGSIDALARLTSQQLAARLGQPFIIENRPGAGGTVGADIVAKAASDGYTLLFTAQGPLVMNPFLMKRLPYDAEKSFSTVTVVAEAPNVLATNPKSPFRSFPELLEHAKKQREKQMFATQGIGTTGHVTGSLLSQRTGLELEHIAYQGFPGMYTDVVTGRVGLMIADTINVVPRVRSGELAPLAVAAHKRSSVLPNVPTFTELGYPEIVSGPWFAVLAPAGTSMAVRRRLASTLREILQSPEVQTKFRDLGVETRGTTPEEFEGLLRSEYKRWGDIIRSSGITMKE